MQIPTILCKITFILVFIRHFYLVSSHGIDATYYIVLRYLFEQGSFPI